MAKPRKAVKKEQCPYCGSQKRAGKPCLSSWCSAMRMAQTPEQIRLWWQLAGPPLFALMLANGIIAAAGRCPEIDPQDRKGIEIARRIKRWSLECCHACGDHGLVTRQWAEVQRDRLFDHVRATFAGSARIRMDLSVEVALCLVDDARAVIPDGWDPAPWNWLECALNTLNKILDPDRQGAEGGLEAYEQMKGFMFGDLSHREPQPKLYLVGGRILTVAFSRPEARDQVLRDLGLVMRDVRGLDPRAKCVDEDGRAAGTYGDVLAEAVRTQPKLPTVIGRAA
jgi:hypothetical protein